MIPAAAHPSTQAAESYAMLNRATGMPASAAELATLSEAPAAAAAEQVEDRSLFAGMLAGLLHDDSEMDTSPDVSTREAAEKRETELRSAAEQLVATTFIMPLFSQLRNDPMASEMFHGGRGEKVFQQQLDQILSDRISTGSGFDLVDTVADYFAGRRGGASEARSVLGGEAAPVMGEMPGVDLHG